MPGTEGGGLHYRQSLDLERLAVDAHRMHPRFTDPETAAFARSALESFAELGVPLSPIEIAKGLGEHSVDVFLRTMNLNGGPDGS